MKTHSVLITSSQTWTPPVGVTAVWVNASAGGGGAGGASGGACDFGTGGGGSGEFCRNRLLDVSSGSVAIVVGAGGVGGTTGNFGSGGTPTIVGEITLGQGWFSPMSCNSAAPDGIHNNMGSASSGAMGGGPFRSGQPAGLGGGGWGGILGANGEEGWATSVKCFGGSGGAGAGKDFPLNSVSNGAGSEGSLGGLGGSVVSGIGGGGGGGGSSLFGNGGQGANAGNAAIAATSYGSGGGGAGGDNGGAGLKGGNGAAGAVLLMWVS